MSLKSMTFNSLLLISVSLIMMYIVFQFFLSGLSVLGLVIDRVHAERQLRSVQKEVLRLQSDPEAGVSTNTVRDVHTQIKKILVHNACVLISGSVERSKKQKGTYMRENAVAYRFEGSYVHAVRCITDMLALKAPLVIDSVIIGPRGGERGVRMSCTLRLLEEVP